MSDVVEGVDFAAKKILNKSKTGSLRERMREFVSEHEERDVKAVREEVSNGKDLSEVVKEDREERF